LRRAQNSGVTVAQLTGSRGLYGADWPIAAPDRHWCLISGHGEPSHRPLLLGFRRVATPCLRSVGSRRLNICERRLTRRVPPRGSSSRPLALGAARRWCRAHVSAQNRATRVSGLRAGCRPDNLLCNSSDAETMNRARAPIAFRQKLLERPLRRSHRSRTTLD
jgi:hypothetical protein